MIRVRHAKEGGMGDTSEVEPAVFDQTDVRPIQAEGKQMLKQAAATAE